mmetsp:Transcript_29586/g.40643  ORF Transcript_29586/g.40643 Transcript_29586/m.40643 type:complete len:194 (-) Transcript_29586:467-1048(-)
MSRPIFLNTFTAAPSLNSPNSVGNVMTVIVMFAAVWIFGLCIIASFYWRVVNSKLHNKKVVESFRRKRRVAEVSQSTAAIRENMSKYILQTIPAVFRGKSSLHQCVEVIVKFNRYFSVLRTSNHGHDLNKHLLTALELISTQCMLFFLLALFYHLQSPADDGTCLRMEREQSCLERKSPLDPYQSYCAWSSDG